MACAPRSSPVRAWGIVGIVPGKWIRPVRPPDGFWTTDLKNRVTVPSGSHLHSDAVVGETRLSVFCSTWNKKLRGRGRACRLATDLNGARQDVACLLQLHRCCCTVDNDSNATRCGPLKPAYVNSSELWNQSHHKTCKSVVPAVCRGLGSYAI